MDKLLEDTPTVTEQLSYPNTRTISLSQLSSYRETLDMSANILKLLQYLSHKESTSKNNDHVHGLSMTLEMVVTSLKQLNLELENLQKSL